MSLEQELEKSRKNIDEALGESSGQPEDMKAQLEALGIGSGIWAALKALKEFCKNWPKIKKALEEAIEYLKEKGQPQLAAALAGIVAFFDTVARICPLIG